MTAAHGWTPFADIAQDARQQAMQAASVAAVQCFIRERSTDVPIRDLAAAAGVSERTFYRYFPRKEDAIRPFVRYGIERVIRRYLERPAGEPPVDSLVAVWTHAWPVASAEQSRVFHDLVTADRAFGAVRLQELARSETQWALALAWRMGADPDCAQARFAGAAVVAAFRVGWESFTSDRSLDPTTTMALHLRLLAPLFSALGDPLRSGRTAPATHRRVASSHGDRRARAARERQPALARRRQPAIAWDPPTRRGDA